MQGAADIAVRRHHEMLFSAKKKAQSSSPFQTVIYSRTINELHFPKIGLPM